MSNLTHPMPVWVSRKTADGIIANFTLPVWLFFVICLLITLNVVIWSVLGLVAAVNVIF